MTRRQKITMYAFALGAILFIVSVPTAFFCTLIWPYNVLKTFQITVDNPVIADDVMRVHVRYDKTRDWGPTKVEVSLLDGITIGLPFDPVRMPMGRRQTMILVPVPKNVPRGQYTVQLIVTYEAYPWKHVSYTAQTTKPIEVIK